MASRARTRQNATRPSDVLTCVETAVRLRVSLKTVYRMVHAGQPPALRFGRIIRIPVLALERMLAGEWPPGQPGGSA